MFTRSVETIKDELVTEYKETIMSNNLSVSVHNFDNKLLKSPKLINFTV